MLMRSEYEVVIVGAGPTALMLAGELALAGVEAVIVERRPADLRLRQVLARWSGTTSAALPDGDDSRTPNPDQPSTVPKSTRENQR